MKLNIIMAIYDKPIGNIILNWRKIETIPFKFKNETRVHTLPLLFNIVLDFLTRAIRQEE
jgi:hypothetical protein